jgi:SAM-dependent methyltransferase
MVIRVFVLACLLVFALPWSQAAPGAAAATPAIQEYEHGGDVPYVPTPHDVVEQMLKLAGVKKTDVVYDLGCGDGRIVIMAAQKFGARGVGIDIDPERIAEAKQNAEQAGVTDRVKFIQQNLFDADIREATVVTLYLLPSVNLRLRPKLLEQLKPGARIVSHSFDMGDWKPDKEIEYNGRKLYLWVIKPQSGNAR